MASFYAIGLIIDDSVKIGDLTKARNIASTLSGFFTLVTPEEGVPYYTLRDVSPEVRSRMFVIITRKVPPPIKSKIQAVEEEDGIILPAPATMWLDDGTDYSRPEVERRLKLWVREEGGTHIWIVDMNSDLSGDLLSKFQPIS